MNLQEDRGKWEKGMTISQKIELKHKEEALNRLVLRELLGTLEKKERDLIVRRYFYDQTQTKIAEAMGISQVQVSRMEKRILKKMREGFE